jgi:carbamoyltransferase
VSQPNSPPPTREGGARDWSPARLAGHAQSLIGWVESTLRGESVREAPLDVAPERRVVLGLNAYHGDSSACITVGGKLVAAVEEERFRRIKHWAGFPSESIRYCLAAAGVRLAEVDAVAVNADPAANRLEKMAYLLKRRPSPEWVWQRLSTAGKKATLSEEIERAFPNEGFRAVTRRVEHHLCHLASGYLVGPFPEAVAVSVDGFGDFASAAWGLGSGGRLSVDGRVLFPHSLGAFYQAITQFLGFTHYGDEYKVMGLAPYGKPTFLPEMRKLVKLEDDGSFRLGLEYFIHDKETFHYTWEGGSPEVGRLWSPALVDLLGPARQKDEPLSDRHKDLAHSAQAMYEEAFFHLLGVLHARYKTDALVLAGGCAANSVANGKVALRSPFRRVYVQAAAGDAGGAIGAAMVVAREGDGARLPSFSMDHAYWGPSFEEHDFRALLDAQQDRLAGIRREEHPDDDTLVDVVAQAIERGEVVGWFQGRMEWGPRALGNRSIVADPRRADMKDILNSKIKRRESFRPFAPSILEEESGAWFEQAGDVPFMMQVFQVREDKRAQVPAITHVDGSGRLQTVSARTNPIYHRLIRAFQKRTGVPMVLNTSFNENEPVVCKPQEALDCFLRTNMDLLVLGHTTLRRSPA